MSFFSRDQPLRCLSQVMASAAMKSGLAAETVPIVDPAARPARV
jgi:hypothetical protein